MNDANFGEILGERMKAFSSTFSFTCSIKAVFLFPKKFTFYHCFLSLVFYSRMKPNYFTFLTSQLKMSPSFFMQFIFSLRQVAVLYKSFRENLTARTQTRKQTQGHSVVFCLRIFPRVTLTSLFFLFSFFFFRGHWRINRLPLRLAKFVWCVLVCRIFRFRLCFYRAWWQHRRLDYFTLLSPTIECSCGSKANASKCAKKPSTTSVVSQRARKDFLDFPFPRRQFKNRTSRFVHLEALFEAIGWIFKLWMFNKLSWRWKNYFCLSFNWMKKRHKT